MGPLNFRILCNALCITGLQCWGMGFIQVCSSYPYHEVGIGGCMPFFRGGDMLLLGRDLEFWWSVVAFFSNLPLMECVRLSTEILFSWTLNLCHPLDFPEFTYIILHIYPLAYLMKKWIDWVFCLVLDQDSWLLLFPLPIVLGLLCLIWLSY